MRKILGQPCLRSALAALFFAVMLLGPLGLCCHEHGENLAHHHDASTSKVCVGFCACHFSFTVADEPRAEAPAELPAQPRAINEQPPRTFFVAGIDHPPKKS